MRKPNVVPHANKNFVSTSSRSVGRKSAKAMKRPANRSHSRGSDGTVPIFMIVLAGIWEICIQTGILS